MGDNLVIGAPYGERGLSRSKSQVRYKKPKYTRYYERLMWQSYPLRLTTRQIR
jgi:hypothetical protein